MATWRFVVILCIISLAITLSNAQSNITRGSSLQPTGATTSWFSPSRLYAFGFYPQTGGYRVGIYLTTVSEKTVVWTANRDSIPFSSNATLRFTSDGRLTVEQTQGQQINLFDTNAASFASMQDSGNFVLYDSTGRIVVWESFHNPTDTLLVGQRLRPGQTLFSSVSETDHSIGVFQLKMQDDGNLVSYPNRGTPTIPETAFFSTGTFQAGPNVTLNLDSGGFLYLLQNSTFLIYNLTQGGYPTKDAIYVMKLSVDGILRLYQHDLNGSVSSVIKWESSANKCVGKGLYGSNGYCSVVNEVATCRCIPGFEVINPDRWSSGCRRNDSVESCKIQDADNAIQMTNLNNARWEETTYAIAKAPTQEQCSSACMNDCNCEAALFTGQECRLQKLPLRYIEVISSLSDVGLIKLYPSSVTNGLNPTNPSLIHVKKLREKKLMVIGISLISLALIVLLISGVIMYRSRNWAYKKISENLNVQLFDEIGPRAFSYSTLEKITDGFKEELGRGAFGVVYKGVIESSTRFVAVKKLKEELSQEGEREFETEMKVIGRTHHRNLTKLLGYCCEGPERLLVFEYMTHGSLADILFKSEKGELKPSWIERIGIAVDIAHGILYLHEECENPIIHCDIKPPNILLDEHRRAKISDFGLAKLLEHDQTKTSTLIRGTRGYVAPEWYKRQPITVKVDVYSFGIVLFNILCCRRNVDNSIPDGESILEEWVYACYEANEVLKLVDYDEDVEKQKLEQMVKIGLWCIQEEPSLRPSMKKVVLMLEGTVKIPVPPNPTSFLNVV